MKGGGGGGGNPNPHNTHRETCWDLERERKEKKEVSRPYRLIALTDWK